MYQWTKPVFGNSTQWFAEVLVSLLSIKVYTVIIYILYDLEKKRLENKSIYVYMVLNLEFHLSLVTVTCLCNQCLSPLKLKLRIQLMARCIRYNIMWSSLSVTSSRPPPIKIDRHEGWNIVESGVKHHNPNN